VVYQDKLVHRERQVQVERVELLVHQVLVVYRDKSEQVEHQVLLVRQVLRERVVR